MRKKLWVKYCIYIFVLSGLIFLKEYVISKLDFAFRASWGADVSYNLLITTPLIFNILIGILLGIEHLTIEFEKPGRWKINLPKIIIVGLPSLFFSFTHHYASINNLLVQTKLLKYATLGTNFVPIFQIVLGYVLITSLNKYYQAIITKST